jgi:hypothetical protein
VQELKTRGVTLKKAIELSKIYGEDECLLQVEHYDYLIAEAASGRNEKPPQSGAWLVTAIEDSWTPPPGFMTRAKREKEARLKAKLDRAEKLLEQEKLDQAEEAYQDYIAADGPQQKDIESRLKKALKDRKTKETVDDYIKNMSEGERAEIEKQVTVHMLKTTAFRQYANDKTSRFFQMTFRNIIREEILNMK